MAKSVSSVEEVQLLDDSMVLLRSLRIAGLKKFMARWGTLSKSKDEEEGMQVIIDCAAIALMKDRPEFWDKSANNGEGGASEEFEEAVDMPTINKIIEVCGGIKLNDPNLIAAVEAAGALGTN